MKQTQMSPRTNVSDRRRTRQAVSNDRLRLRYEQRKKKRQRQIKASRTALLFLLCALLVFIVLFMTPLFNVRSITVSGNNVITLEEINNRIGDLDGENLLKVSRLDVEERLSEIAYIKEISINKNYFKTSLNINILEREAVGYLGFSGKNVLFDDECVILAETNEKPEDVPLIIGISDSESENTGLNMSKENIKIMIDCLKLMRELNLLEKVDNLNLSDETQIRFKYDDRLEVSCGAEIDLDRKLRLFEAMVNNNNLPDNAKGTVDLSITGNARYIP